ncbi:MAG: flagellar hook protein FlgE [Halanaerobiales bacterium]|nr:flagellar hook protein FlgE [Halanaerobiales bacterium]
MLRSMYAGVSGLDSHQQMMDVIGNNIANVNTVGFKRSRVTFQEMLTQTIQGASAARDTRAGTNPQQVGLGTSIGSIDNDMSSGNLESTGQGSDVAIQGDGFFVLRDGASQAYSRAGNFGFDEEGNLYSLSNGLLVQGWISDADGEFNNFNTDSMGDITLKNEINAEATSKIEYGKNLDAALKNELSVSGQDLDLEAGGETDSLDFSLEPLAGADYNKFKFTLAAENEATEMTVGGTAFSLDGVMEGQIELDKDGNVDSFTALTPGSDPYDPASYTDIDASTLTVNINGTGNAANDFELTTIAAGDSADEFNLIYDTDAASADNDPGEKFVSADYEFLTERKIQTDVYDSQGAKHTVDFMIEKTANNVWQISEDSLEISGADPSTISLGGTPHEIIFDEFGNINSGQTADISFTPAGPDVEQTVELDFSALTQFANSMTATSVNTNGNADGSLESFSFTESGNIVGAYDNGLSQTLAKIALADFSNPAGLVRKEGLFEVSANSGDPDIGAAAEGGRGSLAPSNLEMSNANLSKEFTKMITAQRGFQANSKVITTSDEMLQELVNLKR